MVFSNRAYRLRGFIVLGPLALPYPSHYQLGSESFSLGPRTAAALANWTQADDFRVGSSVSVYRQAEPRHKESRNFRTTPTRVISIAGRDGVESGDSDSVDNG